jgi:hypothetical protein
MGPAVRALQKILNAFGDIPLLMLVGYFDVLIIGGAALVAHAVETQQDVEDNVAVRKAVAGEPTLGSSMPRDAAAGTPLQRMTSPYIWVGRKFRDSSD